MEILQLRYFCEAANLENFSQVAKKYSVPTSDISQSIKRLEIELGASLFTRSANRVKLNEKGEKFYKQVSEALFMLDSAVKSMTEECGTIRILMLSNRNIVMKIIEEFRNEYPNVHIIAKHNVQEDKSKFDIIITAEDLDKRTFEKRILVTEEMVLAYSDKEPLPYSISEISALPFISMSAGSNLYALTQKICRQLGFEPNIVIQSDDPFYIRRCIELGLGVAIIPSFTWKGLLDGIKTQPLNGFKRTTYIYKNKYSNSFVAKEFINKLENECINP